MHCSPQGTGSSLRIESPPSGVTLPAVEEEKVSNIVEVCNVSREEALRVLDACHMDETMAIERFLSGNQVSTWSEVSKKKKPTQTVKASTSRGSYGHPRKNDRNDRDRDRDRRDRDRSSHYQSDQSGNSNGYRRGPRQHAQHGYSHRQRDSYPSSSRKRSPPPADSLPNSGQVSNQPLDTATMWPSQDQTRDPSAVDNVNGETWGTMNPTDTWPDPKPSGVSDATDTWVDPSNVNSSVSPSSAWGLRDSATESSDPKKASAMDKESSSSTSAHVSDSSLKQPTMSTSTVKRTFNYAAAAASGTSHEKPGPVSPKVSIPVTRTSPSPAKALETESTLSDATEEVVAAETIDSKKRRNRGNGKPRSRVDVERSLDGDAEVPMQSPGSQGTEPFDSQATSSVPSPGGVRLEAPASQPNAWGTPSMPESKEDNELDDTSTAVAVASAAVLGSDQSAGDSLSLQFGSFGLGGLDGVNWSSSEQKAPASVANTIVATQTTSVAPGASITPPPVSAPVAPVSSSAVPVSTASVGIASQSVPASGEIEVPSSLSTGSEGRKQVPAVSSVPLPAASSGVSGSGMFPMLPVGPGGNFPPPSYGAPYLVPQLHGYSPAMGSYDNGADLGSSRGPNLAPPGSLPLYDPAALPGMASGNGKYGGIPGLGDISSLPGVQSGMGKDSLHGSNVEMEKNNSMSTAGLPAGMDPLAAPYMIPGYPSMQYPMYTFPTGPYAPPPGMAPPGPSPFPYPPGGQVSSQGSRGGFGFEDGPVGLGGNSRNGSGLGESIYTPGGYLNTSMAHSNSQKAPNDGSYKQVRGNPGSALAGMGMAGGMVHGMAYGDYAGGVPGVSNGVGTTGAPGSWNNRQPNGVRTDPSNGPVSNQSIAGASQNSSVYAGGPGAPSGYWGPQQGGYYP